MSKTETAEAILKEYGCPEVPFSEEVTMQYPAIINAMLEFATQLAPVWVKVEDRLPDTNEDVLVYSDTMPRPKISFYDKGAGEWGGKNLHIQLWQPLPPTP